MRSRKKRYAYFLIILLFSYQTAVALDPALLKDTYSILSDEHKHCSPIHGAVWIETGLLKKYYNYYARDNLGHSKYHTVKLLQKMFIVVGQSLSVTRATKMPAHYFSPKLIGTIIGIIEKSTTKDKKQLSGKIENLIKKDAEFNKKVEATLNINLAIDGKLQKEIIRKIRDLANAIVGSLEECDFWTGNSALYPRYMTHAILLAFLYKLSNEKTDLKNYFNVLSNTANKDIFTPPGKNIFAQLSWNSSKFDKNNLDLILNTCSSQINFQPSKNVLMQFLQMISNSYKNIDPFEAFVCAEINKQFYSKSLPLVIGQNGSQPTFEGKPYSDCAEVALRNLCNFVVFDQEKLMFIPVKTEDINPSQKTLNYYQGDQADAKKHTSGYMYQSWGNLLQNIPGVIYTATEFDKHLLGNVIFYQKSAYPCYVLLTQSDIKKLNLSKAGKEDFYNLNVNGELYRVVDAANHKAYGVWQSLKNIIIMLNYLFGLELYDDPLAPFKDSVFCSKYFPKLCEKLGWKFDNPYYQLLYQPAPTLQGFSNLDTPYLYWCHTIPMSLKKDPRVRWNLHLKWHHVEVRDLQTPSTSFASIEYKKKLYDGLLECDDSMNVYALLALCSLKTDVQKNQAITKILTNDTVKNRFVVYLQDLEALVAEGTKNPNILNALKIAQGAVEIPKAKKTSDNFQVSLKQLKSKLLQLHNRLLLLKTTISDLTKVLIT